MSTLRLVPARPRRWTAVALAKEEDFLAALDRDDSFRAIARQFSCSGYVVRHASVLAGRGRDGRGQPIKLNIDWDEVFAAWKGEHARVIAARFSCSTQSVYVAARKRGLTFKRDRAARDVRAAARREARALFREAQARANTRGGE